MDPQTVGPTPQPNPQPQPMPQQPSVPQMQPAPAPIMPAQPQVAPTVPATEPAQMWPDPQAAQPAPAVVEPVAPAEQWVQPPVTPAPTPAFGQPATTPAPMPAPRSKKGLLFGIVGIIVTLLVIAGAVAAFVLLGGPTKADYTAALSYIDDKEDTFKTDTSLTNSDNTSETMKKNVEKIDVYFKELGAMKAMRDDEVKTRFDTYEAEYKELRNALLAVADVTDQMQTITKSCRISATSVNYLNTTGAKAGAEFDKKTADCMKVLATTAKSDNKDMAAYAKAQQTYYKGMRNYYVTQAERFRKRDYSSPSPEYPKYPTAENPVVKVYTTLGKTTIDDDEEALIDILKEKAR